MEHTRHSGKGKTTGSQRNLRNSEKEEGKIREKRKRKVKNVKQTHLNAGIFSLVFALRI